MSATEQYAQAPPNWNRPVAPFRIVGNVYYVGASDVSSFLITTPEGHFLIDTGFLETVPLLESNVAKLGFQMKDIRILLASHAHYDHAGGVAAVHSRTKARMLMNPVEAPLFARGGKDDFAFGDQYGFPPVQPDGPLQDGQEIRLGGVSVTAHFTPGHTAGCVSYSTVVRDAGRSLNVVIPCSLTAPGYQLVDNAKYPGIVHDFESTFAKLRTLPCDVFLGGHSWDFGLDAKRQAMEASPTTNAFIDPQGFRAWVDKAEAAFRKQLAEQAAKATAPKSQIPPRRGGSN
jgi:metallo-beta-lactamase class B